MEEPAPSRLAEALGHIRRGWKLGGEDFLDWMLEKADLRAAEAHLGKQRDETEEERAQRLVVRELKALGWTEAELASSKKGDPAKIALARLLRAETAVTLKWIAQRFWMGTWTHVSNRLYQHREV